MSDHGPWLEHNGSLTRLDPRDIGSLVSAGIVKLCEMCRPPGTIYHLTPDHTEEDIGASPTGDAAKPAWFERASLASHRPLVVDLARKT